MNLYVEINSDRTIRSTLGQKHKYDMSALEATRHPATALGLLLPYVIDADPAFNAATQKIVRQDVVEADKVRRTATAVSLSGAELDAVTDNTESANLVALWNDWDNITANQQKRVLKRIFKQFLKDRGLI